MRLTLIQPQYQPISSQPLDQPISNQLISSLQEEKYGCQKNCENEWSSCSRTEPPRMVANVMRMQPGPTRMVVTDMQDIKSSFELFITYTIHNIILDCINLEGGVFLERDGSRWAKLIYMHTLWFLCLLVF
jgi:hypothetical protein